MEQIEWKEEALGPVAGGACLINLSKATRRRYVAVGGAGAGGADGQDALPAQGMEQGSQKNNDRTVGYIEWNSALMILSLCLLCCFLPNSTRLLFPGDQGIAGTPSSVAGAARRGVSGAGWVRW